MTLPIARLSVLLTLTLFALPSSAFWILSHHPLDFNARLDPIISPGNLSSHLHTFVGSNAISSTQDYSSIRASSACTTSGLTTDKSSYWAPTLFEYTNNKFTPFNLSYVNTYYLQRGNMKLHAFPAGLRMVAGNAELKGPAATQQLQNVASFVCLNFKSGGSQGPTIPQTACPDGLRAQVIFPSCWDGKNLDSADHKSHMAYPLGNAPDNGDQCPSTHPIRFTTLFYEFIWSVGSKANDNTWVLANGDMLGYSFHGDFMNGWDVNVLQEGIDQCTTSLFNNIEGCAPFKSSINRAAANKCAVNRSEVKGLSNEVVSGYLNKLPGCNTVFNGPLKGKGACGTGTSTSIPATSTSTTTTKAASMSTKHSSKSTHTTHTTHHKHHHHHHHHHHHKHHTTTI